MTKFNLREAIAKNKATFFSSLNENKEYYRDAEADDAEHIDALEKDMKDDKMSSKMKMSELKAKISKQTSQYKKYDKVNYDGEENLIVNILDDGEDENIVLVPMSEIDGEAFSVDSDEISNPKIYSKVNYDGEKHLIVNILKDGDVVLVPMYVIDNEAFSVSKDEIKPSVTENTKMKKSELKAKIKEMVLAEMNLDIQDTTSEYDFLAEKKEDEEDVEVEDTEVDIDGMEDIDVDTTSEVDPDIKAVQDLLTQAQAAAQALGDEKLTDQIGNTITFFTRTHVVDKGAVAEELNEAKSLLFSFDYNTDEDDVDYIQGLLKDARVDAIAQPGLESGEMIVKAKNEVELRKAKKVIQANGFKIYKSVEEGKEMVNEAEGKLVDEKTGEEVTLPYKTLDFRGNPITVVSFRAPHKSSSTGRIYTKDNGEYFPGVAGLKIIDHSFSENLNESIFPMLKKILK
jgi:hypothetical protein